MGRYIKNSRIQNADQYVVKLPDGPTTLRPIEAVDGQIRFNTTTNETEVYYNNTWNTFTMQGDVTIVKDTFTGDGSSVIFAPLEFAYEAGEEAQVIVFVENVHQNPGVAYTFNGSKHITFTSAPPNGHTIIVLHRYGSNDYTSNPYVSPTFQPDDLPDLEGWWKLGTGITASQVNYGNVTQWDDQSGYGRAVTSPTGTRDPMYVPYNGENYVISRGGDGYVMAALSPIPDFETAGLFELVLDLEMSDWTPNGSPISNPVIAAKTAGAPTDFQVQLLNAGNIRFAWYESDQTTSHFADSTVAVGAADFERRQIKISLDTDNGSGGCDVTFYTSTNGGIDWTQLGNVVTQAFTTSMSDRAGAYFFIGTGYGGFVPTWSPAYSGQVYLDGNLVIDEDPDRDYTTGFTFTSSTTGETYGAGGGLRCIIDSPGVLFNGTSNGLQSNTFALSQPWTFYLRARFDQWVANHLIAGFNSTDTSFIWFETSAEGNLRLHAGSGLIANGNLATSTMYSMAFVVDGANSVIQIENDITTGNTGSNTFDVLTLGNSYLFALPARTLMQEAILYTGAHDSNTRANVISYLGNIA